MFLIPGMYPRPTLALGLACLVAASTLSAAPALTKIADRLIYRDDRYYSSFPSIVHRPDGELLVAFRRAPERRFLYGAAQHTHSDANSQLMLVRSSDSGRSWTREPELIYAHPLGGSQDPCMVQLTDGSILCTSYGWTFLNPPEIARLKPGTRVPRNGFVTLGGYILRSLDGGHSWQSPIIPIPAEGEESLDVFGRPKPGAARGAMCEGADGRLYWVVQASAGKPTPRGETHLLISADKGNTWKYSCRVASDPKISFNETSLYETPKGDLVAFTRTADFDGHLVVARSTDHGKSFRPWEDTGFRGYPAHATRLPDQRVLLVYGYRFPPYGIRARVLNAECTDIATAPEVVLRDDGGTTDLGYPWVTMISRDRALVVYYFNRDDGIRTIESTELEIR